MKESQRTCPSCGNEFSGAMEFCPVCMLRKGLAGGLESGESSASEETVNPTTPEQPVLRFDLPPLAQRTTEAEPCNGDVVSRRGVCACKPRGARWGGSRA
jgi:hypothetical protein